MVQFAESTLFPVQNLSIFSTKFASDAIQKPGSHAVNVSKKFQKIPKKIREFWVIVTHGPKLARIWQVTDFDVELKATQ